MLFGKTLKQKQFFHDEFSVTWRHPTVETTHAPFGDYLKALKPTLVDKKLHMFHQHFLHNPCTSAGLLAESNLSAKTMESAGIPGPTSRGSQGDDKVMTL